MTIPVLRPRLPAAERLLPYLRRIDETRWYTNFGPLVCEFEMRLGSLFGVASSAVATQANGTLALAIALQALGAAPGSRCILPSWTFAASAAAVLMAGMVPYFVDVESTSWALNPDRLVDEIGRLDQIGAVMVVSPFGAPIDCPGWDTFRQTTGIPVLIDAAASFDTIASVPAMRPGLIPLMVSLHATKAFGIGEGGFVVSLDEAFMQRVRRLSNFGFEPDRRIATQGINAKLSEYSAAVGLAALDEWPQMRRQWADLTAAYFRRLLYVPGLEPSPAYGQGWVSSYCNVAMKTGAVGVAERLFRSGIDTRRWWGPGCHAQPAYAAFGTSSLPVTQALGHSVLGLPFYVDMTDAEIERVLDALAACLSPP